ncbi:MAG: hypothetical protein AB7G08_21950 [Hyphomicrobiaceae bacterium]
MPLEETPDRGRAEQLPQELQSGEEVVALRGNLNGAPPTATGTGGMQGEELSPPSLASPQPANDGPPPEPGDVRHSAGSDLLAVTAADEPAHPPATGTSTLPATLDPAMKSAPEANAAAEALENLKRMLEGDPTAATVAPAPNEGGAYSSMATLPLVPAHAGGEDALRLPEPLRAPRAAVPERRRLDVHGFLAGFVMSLAFGALLYLVLTAG